MQPTVTGGRFINEPCDCEVVQPRCDCISSALDDAIAAGHVKATTDGTVTIYNYTDACTFDRAWNPATRAARGLIVENATGRIVARPFPKFFNADEPDADTINADEPVVVMDKLDGSLGIIYTHPATGEVKVATRGSLTSEQAQWATAWLADTWPGWRPEPDRTYLVEVIYPANRIVLDYQGFAGLVLLDVVDIATGETVADTWPGDRVRVFAMSFREAVETVAATDDPTRVEAEGFVIRQGTRRVKLKYGAYIALHRLLYGFDSIRWWTHVTVEQAFIAGLDYKTCARLAKVGPTEAEALASNLTDDVIARLPDDWQLWAVEMRHRWLAEVDRAIDVVSSFVMLHEDLPRGEFAQRVGPASAAHNVAPGVFFSALDRRPGWHVQHLSNLRPSERTRPTWAGAENIPD